MTVYSQHRNAGHLSLVPFNSKVRHDTLICGIVSYIQSLILAQDERWRRGLGMQVKGAARQPADEVVIRRYAPKSRA